MSDLAYGAFVGGFSVLLVILWLSKIDQDIKNTKVSRSEILAATPAYKRFTLVAALAAVIGTVGIYKNGVSDPNELIPFSLACLAFCVLTGHMVFDSHVLKFKFDETGIYGIDRFRGERKICWDDIQSVKIDKTLNVFIIQSATEKIRLSRYSEGIYELLSEIKAKAPASSVKVVSKFMAHPERY